MGSLNKFSDTASERSAASNKYSSSVVSSLGANLLAISEENFNRSEDGSERRTQKSNKVYEHIKKEIDIRAKRGGAPVKPAFQALSSKTKSNDLLLDTISKGLFVDANRNAAVSAGDRDLKSDVRDKKLREKKIGDAEDDTEVDFMIYVNQAQYEMNIGCPEVAIIYLNLAIGLKPETDLPFLVRSKCLNLLNRAHEAMVDAETAKSYNNSCSAIIAKAEALYNMGQFEMALVYYYRASRIRSDGDIELGMEKCRSAILNVVRAEIHCDQELVNKIIEEEEKSKTIKKKPPETKKNKKEVKKPVIKKCGLRKWRKPGNRGYLGQFEQDLAFLKNFVEFQKNQETYSEYTVEVKNLAANALNYLEDRSEFWQQSTITKPAS